MITQEQAKKLLTKKRLTGHEAGKLWMEDSWLVDAGEEGLLTEKELRSIGSRLRSQEDIETYNAYLETYKRIGFAIQGAKILALEVKSSLYYLCLEIKEYLDRETSSRKRPVVMPTKGKDKVDILLSIILTQVAIDLRDLMAYDQRIREVSETTGVDFSSGLWRLKGMLQEAIGIYNFYAEDPEIKAKKIILEKVRPDKKTYKYLLELIPPIIERGATDGKKA